MGEPNYDSPQNFQVFLECSESKRWELYRDMRNEVQRLTAIIDAKLHLRRCHDCGYFFYAADAVVPYCLCDKCKSQDTRRVRSAPPQGVNRV